MGRRPILPLGDAGPWVLAAVAVGLVAWGLITSTRLMLAAGVGAAVVLAVAYPLAGWLLGAEEELEEPKEDL
jgi:H+/Cl- antiporter ClcA